MAARDSARGKMLRVDRESEDAGLEPGATKAWRARLPNVIVPILIAATLTLMAVADLLIVISGLFYIAGKGGGQGVLLGIQVGFWTGLCSICAFVAPPKKSRSLTPVRKQRDRVRDDTKACKTDSTSAKMGSDSFQYGRRPDFSTLR